MFKVIQHPTFRTVAKVQVPTEEGIVEQSFGVRFRVSAEIAEAGAEGGLPWLKEHILSLDDLCDEAGAPLAYSESLRDQLLAQPYVRVALFAAYFDATSGVKAARRGN